MDMNERKKGMSSSEKSATHTRGGTHEQHVEAGRKGGEAPHKCRGRACHKE